MFTFRPLIVAACAVSLMAAAPAAFAQTGNIELELNTAADADGGCRLTYVATNRVVQFDLPNQSCADLSRISVNGPVECTSSAGEETVCRDSQILSSRVRTIQFN